jgi:hypothetical protein
MVEISQLGLVDKYGMLYEFPTKMGHYATLRISSQNGELFALKVAADIPQADLLGHDQLICERGITPNVDDICIALIGPRKYLLVSILEVFPKEDEAGETHFSWNPIAYNDETNDYFMEFAQEQNWILETIPESLIFATVTWMQRQLAF